MLSAEYKIFIHYQIFRSMYWLHKKENPAIWQPEQKRKDKLVNSFLIYVTKYDQKSVQIWPLNCCFIRFNMPGLVVYGKKDEYVEKFLFIFYSVRDR